MNKKVLTRPSSSTKMYQNAKTANKDLKSNYKTSQQSSFDYTKDHQEL